MAVAQRDSAAGTNGGLRPVVWQGQHCQTHSTADDARRLRPSVQQPRPALLAGVVQRYATGLNRVGHILIYACNTQVGRADDRTPIDELECGVARGVEAQDRGDRTRSPGNRQRSARGPPVGLEEQLAAREVQGLDHVDEPPHRSRKRTEDMGCLPRRLQCGCAARRLRAILGGARCAAQPRSTGFVGLRLEGPQRRRARL
jgi:hypothetical protein